MKQFWAWFASMAALLGVCIAIGVGFTPLRQNSAWALVQQTTFHANLAAGRARPAIFQGVEFRRILWNNLRIDLLTLAGTVVCGLLGCAELAINGLKMGSLYAQAHVSGIPAPEYLKYVVPHAVFEYGGYLTAQAAALCYARQAWRFVNGKKANVGWGLVSLAPLSLLLILVGAWVEVYITPFL